MHSEAFHYLHHICDSISWCKTCPTGSLMYHFLYTRKSVDFFVFFLHFFFIDSVLYHFQQYYSHIAATDHIFTHILGFNKGAINFLGIKSLAFISFPIFHERHNHVSILKTRNQKEMNILKFIKTFSSLSQSRSCPRKMRIFPLQAPAFVPLSKYLAYSSHTPLDWTIHCLTGIEPPSPFFIIQGIMYM